MVIERHRALTLLELTVVVVILAIATAIAVPRFSRAVENQRASAAVTRIAADLRLARTEARSRSAGQSVVFNVAGDSYQMTNQPRLDRRAGVYVVNLGDEPFHAKLDSVTLSAGGSTISFDGYGQSNTDATIVVSAGGFTKQVLLDGQTGRVDIQQ